MKQFDVCVITTIHPPMDQRIFGRGVQAYLDAGYTVCLVAPWPEPKNMPESLKWIKVSALSSRAMKPFHAFKVFRKAYKVKTKAYHFHDLDFILFGVLLRLLTGSKVIYDEHENYKEDILYNKAWIPAVLRPPLATLVWALEGICSKLIGAVVVPVEGMDCRFSAIGVKTAVIHNYSRYEAKKELVYGNGLIYIGSLTVTYGLYSLLGIARELKARNRDIPIIMTDKNADEKTRCILKKAVEEEGLGLVILPIMPFTQIHTLMRRGRIGLSVMVDSPEKRKSIASKIFEYMAYGLPTVGENFGHTKRIIEESGCGLVADATDPVSFTNAILELYDDTVRLEECRARGFSAMENRYNWRFEERKLLGFVESLINKPSSTLR